MHIDPWVGATAGVVAGVAKTLVSHPIDTIKVYHQQCQPHPRNLGRLYKGLSVPLFRNAFESGLHMGLRGMTSYALQCVGWQAGSESPWVVGALAGVPQALIMTPLDYTKVRFQLGQSWHARHCFRGLQWLMLREVAAGAIFFGIYESLRDQVAYVPPGLAGGVAALSSMIATYPLDTLRTRAQAAIQPMTATMRLPYGSLHAGIHWAILKCLIGNVIALTTFEHARTAMQKRSQNQLQLSESKTDL